MKLSLEGLSHIRLSSGTGVFEHEGVVHRVEVAKTPIGLSRVEVGGEDVATVLLSRARSFAQTLVQRIPVQHLSRVSNLLRPARQDEVQAERKPRVRPAVVGVRPSAVTLHSETVEEGQGSSSTDRDKNERRPTRVLEDSLVLGVGKRRVRLTARTRVEELQAISVATGLAPEAGHYFEPAAWAVWRASNYVAPIKTPQGLHLRFVLSHDGGIAILATNKQPLAWHVLSWDETSRPEALVQAFHLLRIHAVRRLHVGDVAQVSLQGEPFASELRQELENVIERPVQVVPGESYGGDLVAFGLALRAVQPQAEAFNLARSLQPSATILQMMPWGEAAFVVALFACMYFALHFNLASMRERLSIASQQLKEVTWAGGVPQPKLKDEAGALKAEVEPLKQFLSRDLSMGGALSTVSAALPSGVWLTTVTAEDLLWEKNSNKALGQRYVLLVAGALSEREGLAPPEVNQTVHALVNEPSFHKVLPHVKLMDVNWKRDNDFGYTMFSVLATAEAVTK